MKVVSSCVFLLIVTTIAVFAQGGTVFFDNTQGPFQWNQVSNAPSGPTGAVFSAQIYAAPAMGAAEASLQPAGTRVPFRTTFELAGVVESRATVTNPFTGQLINPHVQVTSVPGGSATAQIRIWDSRYNTYEAAAAATAMVGKGAIMSFANTGNSTNGVPMIMVQPTATGNSPYIAKTFLPGFNLTGNPFGHVTTAAEIYPSLPLGSTIYRHTPNGWSIAMYDLNDFGQPEWQGPAAVNIRRAEGFFLRLPSTTNITLSFLVLTPFPTSTISLTPGFNLLVGPAYPRYSVGNPLPFPTIPVEVGWTIYRYHNPQNTYSINQYQEGDEGFPTWSSPTARIEPLEGFWYYVHRPVSWTVD